MLRGMAAAAAAVLLTASCQPAQEASSAPVLAPGAPGESASPATEEEIEAAAEDLRFSEQDLEFLRMMVLHHEQALEMADLAADRFADSGIGTIADRIAAAQELEIAAMEEWLAEHGPDAEPAASPEHGGHEDHEDHAEMPGMASPEEMAEMAAAEGAEFDELFVELMVAHHEGAIEMCLELLDQEGHPQVAEMAESMAAEQQVEINRLHAILD